MSNTRLLAARCAQKIIDGGRSLDRVLAELRDKQSTESDDAQSLSAADMSFVKELVFGVCRWYGHLDKLSQQLFSKPMRAKDRDIHFLLLVGLYQLQYLATADHAAVAETVNGAKKAKKVWAVKLLNACLRRFQREQSQYEESFTPDAVHQLTHPTWFVDQLKQDWPDHWREVLKANDSRPAMCVRVNVKHHSRDDYLAQLLAAELSATADPMSESGIILDPPRAVSALPNFAQGACSVQDTAAQLAAEFLSIHPGDAILDACAAPGGKLAHVLELCDNSNIIHALDIDETRVDSIRETLERLNLNATLATADASNANTWPFDDTHYDRILIDAPCSGTGVIRRHPDIRHHRRPEDIVALNDLQSSILDECWSRLKPGGQLLYATCSVLRTENEQQAQAFLHRHADASALQLKHPSALTLKVGTQTLPGVHPMDGFYYALIKKKPSD